MQSAFFDELADLLNAAATRTVPVYSILSATSTFDIIALTTGDWNLQEWKMTEKNKSKRIILHTMKNFNVYDM